MEKLADIEKKEEKVEEKTEGKEEELTPEQAKWLKHEFVTPTKQIVTEMDIAKLKASAFYQSYLTFLVDLQKAIESKDITVTPLNPKFTKLVAWLDTLEVWINEIPPLQQKMRFGNTAYRTWHERLQQNVNQQLEDILPGYLKGAVKELRVYVLDSFGSYERIDYGTGHELAFMMFLYILKEIGFYQKEDYECLVRNVFYRYIKLMRKLQLTYMLEPAGSHGVWGIDDYHFLPFLLGASELIKNPIFQTPDDIHRQKLVDENHEKYMYISCIKFIKEVKKGVPFHESSPILNDISAAESWNKVATGMIKMYQAEVLNKHPVIKHSYYGSIINLEKATGTK